MENTIGSVKKMVLRTNSGFSLVEAVFVAGLVGGLSLMIGHGLATQKKQELVMTNKLSLTSVIENTVGRLNSTTVMSGKFNKIFKAVLPEQGHAPTTTEQLAFSNCIQKQSATNCTNYKAFLDPPVDEIIPVGQGINLVTRWTSAIQCGDNYCGSYLVNVALTLTADTPAAQASDEFKVMQSQLARMTNSRQREFPILSLVEKSDMSYQCVRDGDGNPQLVVGLNTDDATATCGIMAGNQSCVYDNRKPLKSIGGVGDSCDPLVQVAGCNEGVGTGGFFDGSCKTSSAAEIRSFVTKDANDRPISVVICGPGGQCATVAVADRFAGSAVNIEEELRNSQAYNQLMTTWKTEGNLVPAKNLGVDTINPNAVTFESLQGGGIPGADHLTIALLPSNYAPPGNVPFLREPFGARGGNVNSAIFNQDSAVVENPHPLPLSLGDGGKYK